MGDAAGQLAERLQLLCLGERDSSGLELFLGFLPLRRVAGDLRKADMLAVLIVDGVDQYIGPEKRSVLADAPGFALILAFAERGIESVLRLAARPVLFGVKAGEMLPDDLAGRVSLDELGTGIPVGDPPVHVEHVDRVVADTFDQHPKPLLAFVESLFPFLLVRDVAGDLREAEQGAVRSADLVEHRMRPEPRSVLADSPALGLEPTFAGGDPERPPGHVGRAVLFAEETREMLADDLVGLVALEALGAGIPGRDAPFRVEHID